MLGRAWRWIREQLAFLIVVAGVSAAFVYLLIEPARWRPATTAIAIVVLAAAALRLVMPTARVGFLAVRSRWMDTVVYAVLGGLILAVDIRLPT